MQTCSLELRENSQLMSAERAYGGKDSELTEDAHDIATFANLLLERVVPLLEQSLLLVEDRDGAVMQDVGDALQLLDVVQRRPLDDPAPEGRRPKFTHVREQYTDDDRSDQLGAALEFQIVSKAVWDPIRSQKQKIPTRTP